VPNIPATITSTSEVVFIVGWVGGVLLGTVAASAIILHADGSLTVTPIGNLTVNCVQYGCPV